MLNEFWKGVVIGYAFCMASVVALVGTLLAIATGKRADDALRASVRASLRHNMAGKTSSNSRIQSNQPVSIHTVRTVDREKKALGLD